MWAFGKYVYFSKATTCIRGLVFSHSFANHAIMSILITCLTRTSKNPGFQIAAIVTNMQEGASDIMIIVFTHISHTYKIGCFNVIATTNAAYILGLLLLWLSSEYMSEDTTARVFYGALILLTMGEAGRSAALEEFLDDQYSSEQEQIGECTDEEKERLEKRVETRRNALWNHPWFLGAVVPLFLLNTTWTPIFLISTIGMGVSYLLFWGGFSFYFINNKYSDEEARKVYLEKQAERGNFWTVIRKLKKRKHFRKEILSMWLSFLVYSVVTAAGSTFFYEQMNNLHNPFSNYNPAVYFSVLSSLSKYIISLLYELIIPKRWVSRAFRMRIGVGMAFTVLSCGFAWRIEIHRLEQVHSRMYKVGQDIPMSIFLLVPQFIFLGVMEGLVIKGVIGFLVDQMTDDDDDDDKVMAEYYGSHTTDFFLGIGKLLTALSILAFRTRWFDDSINLSRLDKYFRALTFLSLGSFCYYLCVAYYFYPKDIRRQSRYRSATLGVEMVENP